MKPKVWPVQLTTHQLKQELVVREYGKSLSEHQGAYFKFKRRQGHLYEGGGRLI